MRITWKITKKRGNWRPVLQYKILLEEWERELNIQIPHITTNIPETPDYGDRCSREADPAWTPKERIYLKPEYPTNHHLPWRPGPNPEYPEVEEAMAMLRDAVEAAIIQAHDSLALEITGALEMTPQAKKRVAAYVAARKMLSRDQNPGKSGA